MRARNRRFGFRVPMKVWSNQFLGDHLIRGITKDISHTGIFLKMPHTGLTTLGQPTKIALEFTLPEQTESIWAVGEMTLRAKDWLAGGAHIRFLDMARCHADWIRDFCRESRYQAVTRFTERLVVQAN